MSKKPRIRSFSDNPALVKERRKQIAEHSAAVIVKRGFEKTTIRQIAKACSLPVGTLYYYVGSKEDVLYLVIENGLSNFQQFCNDIYESIDTMSATEGLKVAIMKYYRLIDDSQNLVIFSFQEMKNLKSRALQQILGIQRDLVAVFESILTKGSETGEFRPHNTKVVANTIVSIGGIWAPLRWFLREICTLEQYILENTELILRGICQDEVNDKKIL